MVYRWDQQYQQVYFHLAEEAPYVVGAGMLALGQDTKDKGVPLDSVRHWITHTGGQTVMDSLAASLGLDHGELSGTREALKNYGNNSSVSFLFAFAEWLVKPPCAVASGDPGVFITMGPGAGLELCYWTAGQKSVRLLLDALSLSLHLHHRPY